jgi:choline monooxygenase
VTVLREPPAAAGSGAAPAGLEVHADVRQAWTLPGWAYRDAALHELAKERIFAPSWQLVSDTDRVRTPGHVLPLTVLEGCLDEPLLLTRDDEDRLHCLSNVCTHRGNLVAESEGKERFLRCRYHGRRFRLDGSFLSMPEFEQAQGFPSPKDDLPRVQMAQWGKLLFASLSPRVELAELFAPVAARVGWIPWEEMRFAPERSRDYLVQASWMLYCDNYLEGFHIPFVHAALADALDYGSYRTELFPGGSLQVGIAKDAEDCFDLPAGHPDEGQAIAAWYFWLFPNLMLNFYPWGLSINVVRPLAVDRTRVSYLTWVWKPERLGQGAGAAIDRVEREDEEIVETVQRGVRSRLYDRGRYSPARETGVHHFHRMVAAALGT